MLLKKKTMAAPRAVSIQVKQVASRACQSGSRLVNQVMFSSIGNE